MRDEFDIKPQLGTRRARLSSTTGCWGFTHQPASAPQSLYTQSQTQFNAYVSSGTLLNNYAHIFDLLIRLRQAVNHPYLVQYSERNYLEKGGGHASLCGICKEAFESRTTAGCGHAFCKLCVEEYIETAPADEIKCPYPGCLKGLTVDLTREEAEKEPAKTKKAPPIMQRMLGVDDFRSSTKIEGLMEELELLAEQDPCAKGIVFSQFVSMLDLVDHRLLAIASS